MKKDEQYKRLIDGMVLIAHRSVSAGRIYTHGHPVRPNEPDAALSGEEKKLKAIFAKLTPDDRQVLARAFLTERQSGVHDIAAFLQEATSKHKMTIQWDGQSFGPSPFKTMQDDFVARLKGDAWEKR